MHEPTAEQFSISAPLSAPSPSFTSLSFSLSRNVLSGARQVAEWELWMRGRSGGKSEEKARGGAWSGGSLGEGPMPVMQEEEAVEEG